MEKAFKRFLHKKEIFIMKKLTSVLTAFLVFTLLLSSCGGVKLSETAEEEPSSTETKSLPMSSDSLKINLGKAKLYFTTDSKNSVRSVENNFNMLGSFCADIIISEYTDEGEESLHPDNVNWGGYDIKNGELTKFLNNDSLTADLISADSVIMNDTDLYEFVTPKHEESNNGKCVLMCASYSYGECTSALTIDYPSPSEIKMSKLSEDEFIYFADDVMKYNVKTKENVKFVTTENGVEIVNACAYDNIVYIICDISGKKQLRTYGSDGILQSTASFPDSLTSFGKFKVFGSYMFIGDNDTAIYKLSDNEITLFEKERDPAEIYLIDGSAGAVNTKNCPYVIYLKKYSATSGETNEYKLLNLFNDKVYNLSFTPEDSEYTVVSSIITDEYGSILAGMSANEASEDAVTDVKYYKIDSSVIKLMLGEKQ